VKYRVTIDGREREVDVVVAPSGAITVTLDGQKVAGDVRPIPGGVSVRIGSSVHDVIASSAGEEVQLASGPARAIATVVSERSRSQRKRGGGGGAKELRAPMPGRVVRVACKAGEVVTAGQPVVVIEAMKMENEMRAPADATIAQIHVTEGASVEARALLVTFS
jgi:acetyl/propionyl-CoA carboxylase alpha subunit